MAGAIKSLVIGIAALTSVLAPADRTKVDTGAAVVTVLPATGRDLAVFGIVRTEAGAGRLVAWTREVEQLYQSRYMAGIGRFSDPPRLEDVAVLSLDDEDLADLRKCRPGDCGVKLSAHEMDEVRRAAAAAGSEWKADVQDAFRRIIVGRATAYDERGLAEIPGYHDHRTPVRPASEFSAIAASLGFETLYGGQVIPYFDAYPATATGVESFLYWSKETLGAGKPIVSITHVSIFRRVPPAAPAALVAARQVYASHYLTGSLSLTWIAGGVDGVPGYLVYLRRSRTDAFDGPFGGLVRRMVQGRIRSDAPAALDVMRRRLEGGDPPAANTTH